MRTHTQILHEIDQLPGMEEFKSFCNRLVTASDNARRLFSERLPLPNLIFAAAPGCGVTLHISLLSELLSSLHLLQFTGEEEYFEWALDDQPDAFDRLLKRIKIAGGFYGQFRGVVGLDISDVLDSEAQMDGLDRLMEFVNAHQGRILFIFVVPSATSSRIIQDLQGLFASVTPVEVVHMDFPANEARSYVGRKLTERGFTITKKAAAMLEDAVTRLSTAKGFEGYQTLNSLTDAIIWHRLSSAEMSCASIDEGDLGFIFAENGFSSQLKAHAHNINGRRAGFSAREE